MAAHGAPKSAFVREKREGIQQGAWWAIKPDNSCPELPKGIYRRGDAYYVDVIDAAGKRVRRSFGSDLVAALKERNRVEERRARKLALAPTSFEQLVENWLDRHALRSRPRTLKEVQAAAKRVLAAFGDIDARKLTEQRLQAYLVRRRKECGVEQTNKDIRAVRAILRLAVRQRVLEALPMHVELLPSALKKRIPQAVALEDFTRLLARADHADASSPHPILGPLLRLAYFTGLRHQELLHLDWADIDRSRFERLCRYILRPALAADRLSQLPDARLLYRLKHPWRDGTQALLFEPLDFLGKLAALIPPTRAHQVRYHGVFAARSSLRDLVTADRPDLDAAAEAPAASLSVAAPPATAPRRPRHLRWAELLRRVFHFDLEHCPRCGGRLRLLAAILDPRIAQAILAGLPSHSRAPPLDSHALAQQPF